MNKLDKKVTQLTKTAGEVKNDDSSDSILSSDSDELMQDGRRYAVDFQDRMDKVLEQTNSKIHEYEGAIN